MHCILMRITFIGSILSSFCIDAAIVTIANKTGHEILLNTPNYKGPGTSVLPLSTGESKEFNTWFDGVSHIQWKEQTVENPESWERTKLIDLGTYVADVSLGALNIGARFEILTGGKYNYNFGIQGSGKEKQARKVQ
jgi:hypothetical protein